jgi:hypothetical protein
MKHPERALWSRIEKVFPGITDRIENLATVGVPDVTGTCDRGDYWVESKVLTKSAVEVPFEAVGFIRGDVLRPSQYSWAFRRTHSGHSTIFIAAEYEGLTTIYKILLMSTGNITVRIVSQFRQLTVVVTCKVKEQIRQAV